MKKILIFLWEKKIILLFILCFLFLIPYIVSANIVINEVFYNPDGTDTGKEYICLYNNDTEPVNLTGYDLDPSSTPYYTFPSFTLSPKSLVTIHINTSGVDSQTDLYTGESSNMHNTKGPIALFSSTTHSKNTIVDYIEYGQGGQTNESKAVSAGIWTAGDYISDVEEGYSIKLKVDGQDNNSSNDWSSFANAPEDEPLTAQEGETPASVPTDVGTTAGEKNQSLVADAGNDIIGFVGDEINFSGSSPSTDPKNLIFWWNLGNGQTADGQNVNHSYLYPGTYLVTLVVNDGRQSGQDTLTVEIYPKSISVNEFIPNPEGKDEAEWIELFNYSNQPVDISGWQLDDEEGGSKPFTFPENTLISPFNYLVFAREATKIALNNDTDSVRLLLPQGVIYQEITYEKPPEGQSSARTPEGFIWSMPTPGLPNIIVSPSTSSEQVTYNQPPETLNTEYLPEDYAWYYKNDFKTEIEGDWTYLPPHQNDFGGGGNLANIGTQVQSSKIKIVLTFILVVLIALLSGIILIKFKRKSL